MKIIGIDPGLRSTGWGVIEERGGSLSHVAHGVIPTKDKDNFSLRLLTLSLHLAKIIENFSPDHGAVEQTFVNKNPNSTLKLGMARGALLLTLAQRKIKIYEYAATEVKKAIVGSGHASKEQVAVMVNTLLRSPKTTQYDASDALAIAICHSHFIAYEQSIKRVS